MKTSAIIRITLFSCIALILTATLCFCILFQSSGFSFFSDIINQVINDSEISFGGSYSYSDSDQYDAAEGSIEIDWLDYIDIEWIGGSIKLELHDGDKIKFSETPVSSDENDRMHYRVNNGRLTIQFRKASSLIAKKPFSKDLVVFIPQNHDAGLMSLNISAVSAAIDVNSINSREIEIESVSGKINLNNVSASACDLESVSGAINANNLYANALDIENVSGRAEIIGEFNKIDFDTVSGSGYFTSSVCPSNADFESVSGDIELSIPENDGFTLKIGDSKRRTSCSFPLTWDKNRGTYGNGSAVFSFESVSGDLNIERVE